jgi:hypothetical protein
MDVYMSIRDTYVENSCPICYDPLVDVEALDCGHKIHTACLEKHFKAECPICRKKHTRVKPKGIPPKSSPGRSVRYVSPAASHEKVVISVKGLCSDSDRSTVETILTKKHRGEPISKHNNNIYTSAMKRIGDFSMTIVEDLE